MKHLIATLIAMIGLWAFSQASTELMLTKKEQKFQSKICEIVVKTNVQVTIVYKSRNDVTKGNSLKKLNIAEIINGENAFNLYHCLLQQPAVLRDPQNFDAEPLRFSSSLSIFFIDSKVIMQKIVTMLNPQQHWKHVHKYIFLWLLQDIAGLKSFFEKVWQKNILFAIAAIMHQQEIYTFEPFTPQGFQLKILCEAPYFYDKLSNLHHYELRISMFKDDIRAVPRQNHTRNGYKKIDGWMAANIVKHLNATARYITPSGNDVYGSFVNGSFTGSLKDIHAGCAHIGFNLRFVLDNAKPYFEELYPYTKRTLHLVVPAAKMTPEYLIFMYAFSTGLWRLLLLNFCLVVFLFIVLEKLVKRLPKYLLQNFQKHWRWYEVVEIFAKAHLGEPLEVISSASSLRLCIITWILFSYLLTRIYFAKLESSFVHPSYEPQVNSLEDLSQLNMPIYAFNEIFESIKVSLDTKYYQIINRLVVRITSNTSLDDFTVSQAKRFKNVAIILNDEMAKEVVAFTFNDETKRPTLHIVKEFLRSFTSSYIVTKGSPFLYKFQRIVCSFFEAGLTNQWLQADDIQKNFLHRSEEFLEDLEADFNLNENDEVEAVSASRPTKKKVILSLENLQGAFYLWLGGICISCCAFGIEFLYFWYQRKRSNESK